jgi:Fe-S cluster assembly scaffold protein SufB
MLDVQTNDVKASHGATMQRLDEKKLFYMTAKGIPYNAAKKMLIRSYIEKVCQHVHVESSIISDILPQYTSIM